MKSETVTKNRSSQLRKIKAELRKITSRSGYPVSGVISEDYNKSLDSFVQALEELVVDCVHKALLKMDSG